MPSNFVSETPITTNSLFTGDTNDGLFAHIRASIWNATHIDIIVAFIQDSGLRLLQPSIREALQKGCQIRIITGDYLHITQAKALQRLLDWQAECNITQETNAITNHGSLQIQIFSSTKQSFHPKAWIFSNSTEKWAFVGSSNWSYTALCTGIEWNLSLNLLEHPNISAKLHRSFIEIWEKSIVLTPSWLEEYKQICVTAPPVSLPIGEIDADTEQPTPTSIQQDALHTLQQQREQGKTSALIVLATGLGKTFLAAFDAQEFGAKKILFVVHRSEILVQASRIFRYIFPMYSFSWCVDNLCEIPATENSICFASVQKLTRTQYLQQFQPNQFDYIIIDEAHHAAASSYQRIIEYFQPKFLLGITATPNRTDNLEIYSLFNYEIAYQADLCTGIENDLLSPFVYIGRVDTIDYAKYHDTTTLDGDLPELQRALHNDIRMQNVWKYCKEYPTKKKIFFCASISHADYVADWLTNHNCVAVSLHSGTTSAPRIPSITAFQQGNIEALCVVDLFNEGIDIPDVDGIVLLRPTQSPIVFLQQIGRGLRKSPTKNHLTIIDIIGNHRCFGQRIQTLLSISERNNFATWLQNPAQVTLPSTCHLDIEMGVIEILRSVFATDTPFSMLEQFVLHTERRPKITELAQLGINSKDIQPSWWEYTKKYLSTIEIECWKDNLDWFNMLEKTPITKSFKMIALLVFVEGNFPNQIEFSEFAQQCWNKLQVYAKDDIPKSKHSPAQWKKYWMKWLLSIWENEHNWISVEKDMVFVQGNIHPSSTLIEMSTEMIQYRLHKYQLQSHNGKHDTLRIKIDIHDATKYSIVNSEREKILQVQTIHGSVWVLHQNTIAPLYQSMYQRSGTLSTKTLVHNFLQDIGLSFSQKQMPKCIELLCSRQLSYWQIESCTGMPPSFLDRTEFPVQSLQSISETTSKIRLPFVEQDTFEHFVVSSLENIAHIKQHDWLICRKIQYRTLQSLVNSWMLIQIDASKPIQIAQLQKHGSQYLLQTREDTISFASTISLLSAIESVVVPSVLSVVPHTVLRKNTFAQTMGLSQFVPQLGLQMVDGHILWILDTQKSVYAPIAREHDLHPHAYCFVQRGKEYIYMGLASKSAKGWQSPHISIV